MRRSGLRGCHLALALAAVIVTAAAPAPSLAQTSASPLLDVPYLAQPPELCGGAAVAMVLRYWGARDVFPEDYAGLVDRAAKGISTAALAAAVRATGWLAIESRDDGQTTMAEVQRSLGLGRPVIALIEVRPQTYHYVVLTGLTADRVILHDPAVAPYRVLSFDEFARAWASTARWMMVILPPSEGVESRLWKTPGTSPSASPEFSTIETRPLLCDGLVAHSVGLATSDSAAAERGLLAATSMCPASAAPFRELAGLKFVESRWTEAVAFAAAATARDPRDEHAWRLLASSRFISGDTMGALAAWNQIDELRADTIDVQGVRSTRLPVVVTRLGLEPRTLLTPDAFQRASRRLSELPAASLTRLRFEPAGDGRAQLQAVVSERDMIPHRVWALAEMGLRAAVTSELRVDFTSLLHAGDLWRTEWRWAERRPRLAVTVSVPDVKPVHGIASIQVLTERQTYRARAVDPDSPDITESRRRVTFGVSEWSTPRLRWQFDGGLDRLADRAHAVVQTGIDWRLADDRLAMGLSGGWWSSGGSRSPSFSRASTSIAWRSTTRASARTALVSGGIVATTDNAPMALWPGAGTGQGREFLLRAHPLLSSDVLVGPAFGRTLAHATGEYAHPVVTTAIGAISVAAFADVGKAWRRIDDDASRWLLDVGAGLRVRAPGLGGAVRFDVAHAVGGRGVVISAGWVQ